MNAENKQKLVKELSSIPPSINQIAEVSTTDPAAAEWLAKNLCRPLEHGTDDEREVYNFMARTNIKVFDSIVKTLPLEKGATVLELGFGTGDCILQVAQKLASLGGGSIVGIEASKGCVEDVNKKLAEQRFDGVSVQLYHLPDGSPFPLESDSVDIVYHANCWYFWSDMDAVLKEVHRVLKKSGTQLVVSRLGTVDRLFGPNKELITKFFK